MSETRITKKDLENFLNQSFEKYPLLSYVLIREEIKQFLCDPEAPWSSDSEYIEFLEKMYQFNLLSIRQEIGLRPRIIDVSPLLIQNDMDHNVLNSKNFQGLAIAFRELHEKMILVKKQRIEISKEKAKEDPSYRTPRLHRLVEHYKFDDEETFLMEYIVVDQVTADSFEQANRQFYSRPSMTPLVIKQYTGLPLSTLLKFTAADRPHIKEGIFPDFLSQYALQSTLSLAQEAIQALCGRSLNSEEFLKIDGTAVATVISSEPGNESFKDDLRSSQTLKPGPRPTDSDDFDLYTHIQLERQAEKSGKEIKSDNNNNNKDTPDLENEVDPSALLLVPSETEPKPEETEDKEEKEDKKEEDDDKSLKPYANDLEYLTDHFTSISNKIKMVQLQQQHELTEPEFRDNRTTQRLRELKSKYRSSEKSCQRRLMLTVKEGKFSPRLERLCKARGLNQFEKNSLLTLIGAVVVPHQINPPMTNFDYRTGTSGFSVGSLIALFNDELAEQIKARAYFYKSAPLVKEGMVNISSSSLSGDLVKSPVAVDRRMLDFVVGLDTEFSELVEGSHLYTPTVALESVVLPDDQKKLIVQTVTNFENYVKARKRLGFEDIIPYGNGLVLLFHGESGTGKTLVANAVANHLKKKVLLINFPSLGAFEAGENLKFIFREAKLNDAILFFDECESIFMSREKGSFNVNMLLTEIERHDGMIILATNRPMDLDEAMFRRITLSIPFHQPDHVLRYKIWKGLLPKELKLHADCEEGLKLLAMKYELTGGFIKNAILSALSLAVARDSETPIICTEDFNEGARLQLRGRLQMKHFDRRFVPDSGIEDLILSKDVHETLLDIVQFEKARSVLFGQWGFGKRLGNNQGSSAIFHGPPGTGKTQAAQAIGYEIGKPLKIINCAEVVSKWVGESAKNIDLIFEEAKGLDAILVFDEAEGLFGARTGNSTSTDKYANMDTGLLLYHMDRYPGVVILTTNVVENIDPAFFRRIKFVVKFEMPTAADREKLWRQLIPTEAPLDPDVNFKVLGSRFELTGGSIKSAVFRAASRAAIREKDRIIHMSDLEKAGKEEEEKRGKTSESSKSMYV